MVTIKDIAKEANVSSGTVSNVLNRKGNVTEEKIRRVEEAVQRLGYEVNESAKILRKQRSRSIILIVPHFRGKHYIELYETLSKNFTPFDYEVNIYYTNNLYEREGEVVRRAISQNASCIVAFPTYIDGGEVYNKIPLEIQLTLIGPRPLKTTRPYLQVSFNYEQIAQDIADYIIEKHYKKVFVFIDSVRFSRDFLYIILQRLDKAGIEVSHFGSTNRMVLSRALDMFEPSGTVDAVVTTNTQRAETVRNIYQYLLPNHMPEIITLSPSRKILDNEYTYVHLDYQKIGNIVSETFIHLIKSNCLNRPIKGSDIVECDKLLRQSHSAYIRKQMGELSIIAAEDSCSTYLTKLCSNFTCMTGIGVNIHYYSPGMAITPLEEAVRNENYDILITNRRNERFLVNQGIYLSKEQNPELIREFRKIEERADTYFRDWRCRCAYLSFNTSCQMLFYRRDLFREQKIMRRYYEQYYRELQLPETLRDFDELAIFFTEAFSRDTVHCVGASMSSFGNDKFLEEMYFRLKAAGISFNPERDCGVVRKKLIQELTEYLKILKLSTVGGAYHISDGAAEFIRGNSVMSIFSTSEARMFNDDKYDNIRDNVGCRDVPGGHPVVNSNIIGILASSNNQEGACAFIDWLYSNSICNILTAVCGQPIIRSSTRNTQILELYPWLKYYNQNIENGFFIEDQFTDRLMNPEYRKKLMTFLTDTYINPSQVDQLVKECFDFL